MRGGRPLVANVGLLVYHFGLFEVRHRLFDLQTLIDLGQLLFEISALIFNLFEFGFQKGDVFAGGVDLFVALFVAVLILVL